MRPASSEAGERESARGAAGKVFAILSGFDRSDRCDRWDNRLPGVTPGPERRVGRVVLKSPAEIEVLDRANRIVRGILAELGPRIKPGVTTLDIDTFAARRIREAGGVAAFKGYPHRGDGRDFPGNVCTSVNAEVVHGIPSPRVVLSPGDIVSVDLGVLYDGYYGDAAATFPVGEVDPETERLLRVTREALHLGLAQARAGNRVSDIGHAVQEHVERHSFSVVREFVGHGIGSRLHEEPQVPNYGPPGQRERLRAGMVLAIEPMVNAGAPDVVLNPDDGWTARTRDASRSAHFELCVAVTESGPRILGEPVELAE